MAKFCDVKRSKCYDLVVIIKIGLGMVARNFESVPSDSFAITAQLFGVVSVVTF